MTHTSASTHPYPERFWQSLSHEFAFGKIDQGQLEKQLQAITETWILCTAAPLELPAKTTLPTPTSASELADG
ncbi:MAG: hypothetical protein AAFZ80_01215 [Cyanobacteria bacterium P01_A01_bin.105]